MSGVAVHIGMGKTGSSVLQRHLLPELQSRHGSSLNFINKEDAQFVVDGVRRFGAEWASERLKYIEKYKREGAINVMSCESLLSWDPQYWSESIADLDALFGRDVTIVLTLRSPEAHLNSMYRQILRQGGNPDPQRFLLSSTQYSAMHIVPDQISPSFINAERYDIAELVVSLRERFDNVQVLSSAAALKLEVWEHMLNLGVSAPYITEWPRENESLSPSQVIAFRALHKAAALLRVKVRTVNDKRLNELSSVALSMRVEDALEITHGFADKDPLLVRLARFFPFSIPHYLSRDEVVAHVIDKSGMYYEKLCEDERLTLVGKI